MRVYIFTPSPDNKNLGAEYNHYMTLVREDDWVCMIDRDSMFIQDDYIERLHHAINKNPDAGLITCVTNRVGDKRQCHMNQISNVDSIKQIRKTAKNLPLAYQQIKAPISGMLMMFKKSTWRKAGRFKDGLLGVDNDFALKVEKTRKQIIVAKGLYVLHYYRLLEGISHKKHLK